MDGTVYSKRMVWIEKERKGKERKGMDRDFLDWYEQALIMRVCKRCAKPFREIDNLGAWKCKYHPSAQNYRWAGDFHKEGTFDCCGLQDNNPRDSATYERSRPFGCTVADHTSKPGGADYLEEDNIAIPLQYAGLFKLYVESSSVNLDKGVVVVRRYNKEVQDERRQFGQVIRGVNKPASTPFV